jgi:hypothetical protein
MLVTPLYLMRLGGIYNMEPLRNLHWGFMSIGFMRLYHYLVLQPISFATEVNLNSIMCPAVSDPFEGPWYRIAAHIHQTFFILLHGKLYCMIGKRFFVPKTHAHEPKETQKYSVDSNGNSFRHDNLNCCHLFADSKSNSENNTINNKED